MVFCSRRRVAAALTCGVLILCGGCTATYHAPDDTPAAPWHQINTAEPAPDEVVVVVNNNAGFGTHAGMFVGARLSDPAGSYVNARQNADGWRGPTLRDYATFQLEDGNRVQLFRFKLAPQDIAVIDGRVAKAGMGRPLYCAADVRDQIAGVGPFKDMRPGDWLSPAGLADLLRRYVEGPGAAGVCVWANGAACRVQNP